MNLCSPAGHRRYDLHAARQRLGLSSAQPQRTIAYARVSAHDQKDQLSTQAERLRRHCHAQGWTAEVIQDLGSGMNYRKPGLRQLEAANICLAAMLTTGNRHAQLNVGALGVTRALQGRLTLKHALPIGRLLANANSLILKCG